MDSETRLKTVMPPNLKNEKETQLADFLDRVPLFQMEMMVK
jgi:hypothetical protein